MNANILKKITIGNPLINLQMWDDLEKHDKCKSDEELATFYHTMLDKAERTDNKLLEGFIYAMINYSTGYSFNPEILLK